MGRSYKIEGLNNIETLNWFIDQPYQWQEEVWKLSKAKTLEQLVKFVKQNINLIKQLEHEKERSIRKSEECNG